MTDQQQTERQIDFNRPASDMTVGDYYLGRILTGMLAGEHWYHRLNNVTQGDVTPEHMVTLAIISTQSLEQQLKDGVDKQWLAHRARMEPEFAFQAAQAAMQEAEGVKGLQVGSIVHAKASTGVCTTGEIGVVYEIYDRTGFDRDGGQGVGIIFREGGHDGFSGKDLELAIEPLGLVAGTVAGYRFQNVRELERDYQLGVFDLAFQGKAGGGQ